MTLPPTCARGLLFTDASKKGLDAHTHMRTGLTFTSSAEICGIGVDAAHTPKIVRRCVPIRGDEQPAAVLLHHSTA